MGLRVFCKPIFCKRVRESEYAMRKKSLSYPEIAELCRGLALLLHAGISLGDGLFLLAEEEKGEMHTLLTQMGQKMDSGAFLSAAMAETDAFPAYVVGMVQVGERAGRMEEALNALAGYYEDRERMDRQVRNALMYPSILLLLMLVVIAVLLIRVLPIFDEVYASLGSRLTGIAGGLLRLGQTLEAVMPLLCVLLAAVVGLLLLFSGNERFRQWVLTFWRTKQGDKGVSQKMNDARFAQALSMGLRSGLPVEEAVELAGALLRDVPAAATRCKECAQRLTEGGSLPQALRDAGTLPASACRMLELGLRGGTGDQVMEEIAGRLSEEASQALGRRVAQVEPAMVLAASLLVGIILLSVMLPLMHIMSAIG